MEVVGEFVSNLVDPLITGFNDWMESMGGPEGMMKALTEKFQQIQPYLPIIAGAIIGGLVPAFVAMGVSIWAALAPLLPFIAAGALLGLGLKVLMDKFGGLKGIMDKLQPVIKFMSDLWSGTLQPAIMEVWKAFSERLLPSLKKLWDQVSPILIPVLKTLGVIMGAVIFAQIMIFVKGLQLGIQWLSNIVNWISNAIKWVKDLVGWFGRVGGMIGRGIADVYNAITAPFQRAFDFIKGMPGRIAGAISNVGQVIRDKLGDWDIPGPLGKVRDVIPGFAQGVRNFGGGFAMVGERGPELVNLPKGSDVFTASESRQMLRGGISGAQMPISPQGGGPQQQVNIDFSPTLQVGMFAGMPTEYRDIAERMWVEFTRIAKSNGIDLQPIGARVQ